MTEEKKKVNKSISLLKKTVDKVESYQAESGGSDLPFSHKVDEMITALCVMKERTVRDIGKKFSVEELIQICFAFGGYTHNTQNIPCKSVLPCCVEEYLSYHKPLSNVNKANLLELLNQVEEFEAYAIILTAVAFWSEDYKPELDMRDRVMYLFCVPGAENLIEEETIEDIKIIEE